MPQDHLKISKWQNNEITIYQASKSGLPFKDLPEKKQDAFITGILFKIAVVTGCTLPINERHCNELENEVKKFMNENNRFSNFTFEEVLTAFRFNAAGNLCERTEHYQNIFNLDYLGKILSNFLVFKNNVEEKARKQHLIDNLFEPSSYVKISDKGIIDYAHEIFIETDDYLFIPSKAYNLLVRAGKLKLSVEEKQRIKKEAYEKIDHLFMAGYRDIYYFLMDNPGLKNMVADRIAKKMAVAKYFEA